VAYLTFLKSIVKPTFLSARKFTKLRIKIIDSILRYDVTMCIKSRYFLKLEEYYMLWTVQKLNHFIYYYVNNGDSYYYYVNNGDSYRTREERRKKETRFQ